MSFATHVRRGESTRAWPDTKRGSIGRGDGLQSAMPCLAKMSRMYFDSFNEIVSDMSRVMSMPRS
jgi:hypothetical protein